MNMFIVWSIVMIAMVSVVLYMILANASKDDNEPAEDDRKISKRTKYILLIVALAALLIGGLIICTRSCSAMVAVTIVDVMLQMLC